MNKKIILITVIAFALLMIPAIVQGETSSGEGVAEDSYRNSNAVNDKTNEQRESIKIHGTVKEALNDLPNEEENGVSAYPLDQGTRADSYVTPLLVRSGNTEKVELYLKYKGDRANAIRFKKIVVENSVTGSNYKVYKPAKGKKYWTLTFSGSTNAKVRVGSMSIPVSKKRAIVKSTGLQVYKMSSGWIAFSEIKGSWKIK